MAARGRGRGAFRGGRGGAGGRGAPLHPVARDDEGNVLETKFEGPPPLFPEVQLPPALAIDEIDEAQLGRRSELASAWKRSPYHLEPPKPTTSTAYEDVERYSDRYTKRAKKEKPPLSSVLTLDPYYFPAELFSEKERRAASKAQAAVNVFKPTSPTAAGGGILKALNQWEDREKQAGEAGAGAAGADKEGEAPEEEDAALADEDDDEIMEDDDYYQGQHFDDDEGYDDYGDDGGGDEAYY